MRGDRALRQLEEVRESKVRHSTKNCLWCTGRCTDGKVSFGGTSPDSCSRGIPLDSSPQGKKTFSTSCDMMGRYANRQHFTVVVSKLTRRRLRTAALGNEQVPVAVSGSPVRDPRWEAKRLATGVHEYPEGCRDIDWCLLTPTCGPHGTCIDGLYNYTCSCAPGYHSVFASNGETCVEVSECDAWREAAACSPKTCIDRENGFPCTCPSDYLTVDYDADKERCEREACGIVPVSEYATHNTTLEISFGGGLGVHR